MNLSEVPIKPTIGTVDWISTVKSLHHTKNKRRVIKKMVLFKISNQYF